MKNINKVSIIMPVYNKEKYLEKTIDSVFKQKFDSFELIILNDGSTDNSLEVLNRMVKKYPEIRLYTHSNVGVSRTRNKGMELAECEYICFLDADDYYLDGFIEEMYQAVKGYNVVYCGNYSDNGVKKRKSNLVFKSGSLLDEYLKNRCIPNTNSWMIKKEYIQKYNMKFPDSFNLGEDMVFFAKVLLHDQNVQVLKKYLTVYNSRVENSLTANIGDLIHEDLTWMNYLIEYLLQAQTKENKKIVFKSIEALKRYRMPASIIYKVKLQNKSNEENRELLSKYNYILKAMKLINGIRSLKLMFIYQTLKR